MVPDLLTTAEVAERLGVDRSTLTRRVQLGRITPAARLRNGAMLWHPDQLDELVAAGTAAEVA
jgi:excisionase family DNA binding protein